MDTEPDTWRQKIRQHPLVAIGVIVPLIALIVLIIAIVLSSLSNGTGFNGYTVKSTATETTLSPQIKVTTTVQSQPGKTLWDLLQLLAALAIPIVVGFGAAWFTAQQGKVRERENKDNQREKALQDYIDKMSELLLEKKLRGSTEGDEIRKIARVRTLTILRRLDVSRKASVIQFLHESGLIDRDECIISLSDANLSGAHLCGAILNRVDLSGAHLSAADLSRAHLNIANFSAADLSAADLSGTHLCDADLSGAHLCGAILNRADLTAADLGGANLNGAHLYEAYLGGANLRRAYLHRADLSGANLSGANLSGVDLEGALGISIEELEKQAKSLEGATMPDGSKHP